MKKLLTIFFAISFLSVSAQYKSNYELTCVDSIYYTKANKFNPSSYECKKGIELKKPNKTKEFFKYPVQIEVDGGQVHLYDFEGNSEVFPITRTIPNSIQEVLDLVKSCNAGVDVVDDADSVIGNENTTNVSVTNVNETYTVTITNADGTTVTDTFDIELFDGVDTTDLYQYVCDIAATKGSTVTNTSITYTTNSDSTIYTTIITDSEGNTIEGDLELPCFDDLIVRHNYYSIPQTMPLNGGIITSDTFVTINNYFLCGELISRDTLLEWVETECDEDQTCETTYKVFKGDELSQCYFATPFDVFTFYTDVIVSYSDVCGTVVNTNDVMEIEGIVSNVQNVTFSGNIHYPASQNWQFNLSPDPSTGVSTITIPFQSNDFVFSVVDMNGNNVGQPNNEFTGVVCTPTCVPPVTEVTTVSPPDASDPQLPFIVEFSATKNGATILDGECIDLIFYAPDGSIAAAFTGFWGDPISSFTGYTSNIFPNGSEIVGQGLQVTINKVELNVLTGYSGLTAVEYTYNIKAGGGCTNGLGVTQENPYCATESTLNGEDYVCKIVYKALDNTNLWSNLISDNGTTIEFSDFDVNPTYGGIGGLYYLSDVQCTNDYPNGTAGSCQAVSLAHDGLQWDITNFIIGVGVEQVIVPIQNTHPNINLHATELSNAVLDSQLFPNFQVDFRNDILDGCEDGIGASEREFRFVQISYCEEGGDLNEIWLKERSTGCVAKFNVKDFDAINQ